MRPIAALALLLLVGLAALWLVVPRAPAAPEAAAPRVLADESVARTLDALIGRDPRLMRAAIDDVLQTRDTRFVAVFIELLRARQLGLVGTMSQRDYIDVLQTLTDQRFETDWPAWVEWYGQTDLAPPPGFTGWKGRLLGRIDPAFADFLRDDAPSRLRVEEIQWGGVTVDGIPALDNPAMLPARAATYLQPGDAVFGIALNGDARAYPLRILDWHEMANDIVGDVPVSLAYCTLCGAGIAYDGRAPNGEVYTFGSSGFLYRSNKLMYDRQTRTLWNQFTGEPVLGDLAATGVRLALLPVVLTTWADWQAQHPDTLVVDVNTDFQRDYLPGAAYGDYFASDATMFPVPQRDATLPAKARVYGLTLDGTHKAYPTEALVEAQVVNDRVGETSVVLVAARGTVEVAGLDLRSGPVEYEAGTEVRAFERGGHEFAPGPDTDTLLDEAGTPWRVTEAALVAPDGTKLRRISGHLAYWFGWYAFFPDTAVWAGTG